MDEPASTGRRVRPRRAIVATAGTTVAALVVLVVAATLRAGEPPVIRLSTHDATAEQAPVADMALVAAVEHRFVLDDGARFDAAEATAFRLEPPADLSGATRDLARRLGIDGDVDAAPHGEGALQVGATDGTGPSLWVGPAGDWSFSDASSLPQIRCVEPASPDRPLEPADGGAASGAPGEPDDPTRDPEADVPPVEACEPGQPPAGVPDVTQARQAAEQFFASLELTDTPQVVDAFADEWGAWVSASVTVDGQATDLHASVAFGPDTVTTSANGTLARVVEVGRYPTVDAETAVERLGDHGAWSGMARPFTAAAVTDAAAPMADPDAPVSSVEAGEPRDVPLPDEPDEMPLPGAHDDVAILPAPDPGAEPEVVEVTLVAAEPALQLIIDADGVWWLLPGVRFAAADGGIWPVLTVSDDYLDVAVEPEPSDLEPPLVDPEPAPAPMPVEPDPAAPRPDPGTGAIEPAPDDAGGRGGASPGEPGHAVAQDLAERVIGVTEEQALALIEEAGLEARVVSRDGERFPVTDDHRLDRINLDVVNGRVAGSSIG